MHVTRDKGSIWVSGLNLGLDLKVLTNYYYFLTSFQAELMQIGDRLPRLLAQQRVGGIALDLPPTPVGSKLLGGQ